MNYSDQIQKLSSEILTKYKDFDDYYDELKWMEVIEWKQKQ